MKSPNASLDSSLYDSLYEDVFSALESVTNLPRTELSLETPPELDMGDFAFPTFKLAKAFRKAPPVIAKEIFEKLQTNQALTSRFDIVTAGPYVNFTVKPAFLTTKVLESLLVPSETLATKTLSEKKNIVLEFSSPNIAKAFNIYHLRSTMIGNCLYRIYKARGYHPIAINHLGDWGTQFGTMTLAFDMWGDEKELQSRGIAYLVELYVRINKEIENDATLKDKAREYFTRLEKDDPKIKAMWKTFVDLSMKEFEKMYSRLNVHFDHYWGESYYTSMISKLEKSLEDKKLLVESEGAYVVPLEQFGMPPCIVQKKDGSSIYATRDLAAAIYRHEQFKFEKMIYIVGAEQKLHFAQVFKVLELMGYSWASQCTHIDFGLYKFSEGGGPAQKMSTRKGRFITLEAVLDEAVERAREVMAKKASESQNPLSEKELDTASEIIGAGAIIYNDLSTDRNHDVNFDLERVLDFDGETGPYIQYAHTRCLSILRNAPKSLNTDDTQGLLQAASKRLQEKEEKDLIRVLAKLPRVLDLVIETSRPNHLANYLIDITKQFNIFYRAQKVLVDEPELARARLALVRATQSTLKQGMQLLGMKTPERM